MAAVAPDSDAAIDTSNPVWTTQLMKTNIAFGYSPLTQVKWSDDVAERFPTGIASRAAPGAGG
ncbi:hypothetical protein MAUB_48410 [Mycolicibacterium aubagnense]|uniref:Uncharacterized protein n=1 Tax=Mycolicibacterium aubagnense TaxID=319707 RepID=A0ABN5YZ48_9MYCO|nr:hypothetical protein MAUB_48410 [Mycolicibacterium aubagnense]